MRAASIAVPAALLAIGLGACAASRRPSPSYVDPPEEADASPRYGVPGLPGFARVDAGLWRSAQPTAEGYRTAKQMGARTVVDLRGAKEDPDLVRAAGLDLVVVRTSTKSLDEDDVASFLRVAMDPARRPVLVHCLSGHDRTGAMVAAYRRLALGWPAEQALAEMRRMGAAPWNEHLIRVVRDLDPEAVRARLGFAPVAGGS